MYIPIFSYYFKFQNYISIYISIIHFLYLSDSTKQLSSLFNLKMKGDRESCTKGLNTHGKGNYRLANVIFFSSFRIVNAVEVKQRVWHSSINLRTTIGEEGITHLKKQGAEIIKKEKRKEKKSRKSAPKQLYRCQRKPPDYKGVVARGHSTEKMSFRCSQTNQSILQSSQLRSTLVLLAGQLSVNGTMLWAP